MRKLTLLFATTLCTAAIGAGTALILRPVTPTPSKYVLKDDGGLLALFDAESNTPRVRYDIYTQLLPPADTEALRYGIPVKSPDELARLLEDLGM